MPVDPKKLAAFAGAKPGAQVAKPGIKPPVKPVVAPKLNAVQKLKAGMSGKSDEDEPANEAAKDKALAERVGKQVSAGKTDNALMERLAGYDPEEDGNPPGWVDDEDLWARAKKAAGSASQYDEGDYNAVVLHIYRALGGTVS